jgi:hypothetical protein
LASLAAGLTSWPAVDQSQCTLVGCPGQRTGCGRSGRPHGRCACSGDGRSPCPPCGAGRCGNIRRKDRPPPRAPKCCGPRSCGCGSCGNPGSGSPCPLRPPSAMCRGPCARPESWPARSRPHVAVLDRVAAAAHEVAVHAAGVAAGTPHVLGHLQEVHALGESGSGRGLLV